MHVTEKNAKLLIALACVLLLAGAYKFGYDNYGERRAKVEENVAALQAKYDELSDKNEHREKYLEDTNTNKEKKEELLAKYPGGDTIENEIYFTKKLEDQTKTKIKQFSYTEPESFYVDNEAEIKTGITGMKSVSTVTFNSDYTGFKKIMNYVMKSKDRRVVESFSLSSDKTTGKLVGTITYNSYYLDGTGRKFNPESIPAASKGSGVTDIFGKLVESK